MHKSEELWVSGEEAWATRPVAPGGHPGGGSVAQTAETQDSLGSLGQGGRWKEEDGTEGQDGHHKGAFLSPPHSNVFISAAARAGRRRASRTHCELWQPIHRDTTLLCLSRSFPNHQPAAFLCLCQPGVPPSVLAVGPDGSHSCSPDHAQVARGGKAYAQTRRKVPIFADRARA